MVCPTTLALLLAATSATGGATAGYLYLKKRCSRIRIGRPFGWGGSRRDNEWESDSKTVLLLDVLSQDEMEDATPFPSLPSPLTSSVFAKEEGEELFVEKPPLVAINNPLRYEKKC
eukprot:638653-Prorocentrum_minimum.AAC.5